MWEGQGKVSVGFDIWKPDKNPSPDPPPTFPPPSGAWARSAGTLAQVWVDRSVQHDSHFSEIGISVTNRIIGPWQDRWSKKLSKIHNSHSAVLGRIVWKL